MGKIESLGKSVMENRDNVVTPFKRGHGHGSNGGNGNYGERLARIESEQKHMATKQDIEKVKVWVLSGVLGGILGGMGVAAGIAVAIAKLFFS